MGAEIVLNDLQGTGKPPIPDVVTRFGLGDGRFEMVEEAARRLEPLAPDLASVLRNCCQRDPHDRVDSQTALAIVESSRPEGGHVPVYVPPPAAMTPVQQGGGTPASSRTSAAGGGGGVGGASLRSAASTTTAASVATASGGSAGSASVKSSSTLVSSLVDVHDVMDALDSLRSEASDASRIDVGVADDVLARLFDRATVSLEEVLDAMKSANVQPRAKLTVRSVLQTKSSVSAGAVCVRDGNVCVCVCVCVCVWLRPVRTRVVAVLVNRVCRVCPPCGSCV
jgi:hypothetical protein